MASLQTIAQTDNNQFLNLSYGISVFNFQNMEHALFIGEGSTAHIGYKHNFKNNRFRICPSFEYGVYNSDYPTVNFPIYSYTTFVSVEWDALRIKSFIMSLDAGVGLQSAKTEVLALGSAANSTGVMGGAIAFKYAPKNSPIIVVFKPYSLNMDFGLKNTSSKLSMLLGVDIALGSKEKIIPAN